MTTHEEAEALRRKIFGGVGEEDEAERQANVSAGTRVNAHFGDLPNVRNEDDGERYRRFLGSLRTVEIPSTAERAERIFHEEPKTFASDSERYQHILKGNR